MNARCGWFFKELRYIKKLSTLNKCCHLSTVKPAVLVGCHKLSNDSIALTRNGDALNELVEGKLTSNLEISNFKGKVGDVRTFYNLHEDYPCITVAGLGEKDIKNDPNEEIDQLKENVRIAVGAGAASLKKLKYKSVLVDDCESAQAAAEGAVLSTRYYDTHKSKKEDEIHLDLLQLYTGGEERSLWQDGVIYSESQKFAAELMETPSNFKYPVRFCEIIQERFSKYSDVEIKIRDKTWAEEKGMECFLSVGQGSTNESRFLELHYKSSDQSPVCLVGKGITFDTGGISIKPSQAMALMRGDMGGAACVLSAFEAVVRLQLPLHLIVLVALAENMPSGNATRPGDVFKAMNGKTVEVDNTDAEGRLVLADALCYSKEFQPSHVINAATLTGAIDVALGAAATGVFSTSNSLWNSLHQAGVVSGDRMWRMPIYNYYKKEMECSKTADLRNTQKKSRSAGSCTAAAFLREFVDTDHWAHLDIAGVMTNEGDVPYLIAGMSGRPTRTVIETLRMLSIEN